jgi:Skp family chaperone for outer membrane proteins
MQYSSPSSRFAPVNRIRRYALAAVVVEADAATDDAASATQGQVRVAAVNISRLFREHAGMRQSLKELRIAERASGERLAAERRQLDEQCRALARLAAHTPAHRAVEADLARRLDDLQQRTEAAERDFRQREARIYTTAYDAVVEGVRRCVRDGELGIAPPLDNGAADSHPGDGCDPFLERIGQAISAQEPGLDITRQVAVELRAVASAAAAA